MSMRWKKFIGMFALLAILFVYSLLVMSLAVRILPAAGPVVEFFFYAVAGIAWVVPTKYLVVWMNSPGKTDVQNS
jgi:hypothetical protein